MYLIDYHCHSEYSFDSKAKLEDNIISAIKKGIKELCITDHFDYGTEDYREINYNKYQDEVKQLQDKYRNKIKFLFGIEVGVQVEHIESIKRMLNSIPFDFKIASTHDVDNIGPHSREYWSGVDRISGYRKYYEAMYNSIVNYKDYDIFGHLDYVIRYGPYKDIGFKYKEIGDILDESMKILIHEGKGIEINTSSIRKGMEEFHPRDEIIKRYIELGGEIFTIGSDAHMAEHVGLGIDRATEKLLDLGINYIATYKDRKLSMKKII